MTPLKQQISFHATEMLPTTRGQGQRGRILKLISRYTVLLMIGAFMWGCSFILLCIELLFTYKICLAGNYLHILKVAIDFSKKSQVALYMIYRG